MQALDFVIHPPQTGNDPDYLVLMLHGYGSNKHDLIGLAPELSSSLPEALFISPDAPFPCAMNPYGGYQWFGLESWNPNDMLEGIQHAHPILDAFITQQLSLYNLTDDRLVLLGFSQGTMMSLHTGLRRKNTCAGILGFSGALLETETAPLSQEIVSKPPVCLVHGMMDDVVPFQRMEEAEATLSNNNVSVETHACPHLMHGIDAQGIHAANSFLSRLASG